MAVNIKLYLFATIVEKEVVIGNIKIKSSIFATIIEKEPVKGNINVKPFLFATIKQKDVFNGDTLRIVKSTDKDIFLGDTLRIIEGPKLETFNGDTCRKIREIFSGDTFRKVVKSEKFSGDTIIRVPYVLKYLTEDSQSTSSSVSTKLKLLAKTVEGPVTLMNTLEDLGIVSLNIGLNEKTLSDTISIESATHMNINEAIRGHFFNYEFNFLVERTSHKELLQNIQGMYNQDELLYTQFYLTNDAISSLLSEEEKQKIFDDNLDEHFLKLLAMGQVFQINGENVTRQNFIDYYVAAHLPVSSFAKYIAQALGLKVNVQMQDFRNRDLVNNIGSYVTYADFLTQAFNWTSQIPQYQVNCFIRGDTLNVIMRGYEKEVIDITDLPHSRPTITRTLVRNMWNNAIEEDESNEDDDDDIKYFSGTLSYSENNMTCSYTFMNGLLMTEHHRMWSWDFADKDENGAGTSGSEIINYESKQTIQYTYTSRDVNEGLPQNIGPVTIKYTPPDKLEIEGDSNDQRSWYLSKKTETSVDEQWSSDGSDRIKTIHNNTSVYEYSMLYGDGVYLHSESTESHVQEYEYSTDVGSSFGKMELVNKETNTQVTLHMPMGNGFYSTMTYQDGLPTGNSISQGKPSQEVSQYTINQVQQAFQGTVTNLDIKDSSIAGQDERSKLSAIINTSFPIVEQDIKNACVEAMLWLNRRIQEEVSIEIFPEVINGIPQFDHVIDFTERIKYEGNEYYLVSNDIELTSDQYIQKLNLIRWY